MTWFESSRTSTAAVTADREAVWKVLSDPDAIADMTPLVQRIDVDGDHWRWSLEEVPGLGVSLAPAFTVRMSWDEPDRIEFVHDPPEGERERAGVEGLYVLAEHPAGCRIDIDLKVRVDLPLPKISSPAVRTAIDGVLASMGRGFSKAMLKRLDAREVEL